MCGIAGYVGWERSPEASDADLRRMCGAIVHRGPDDEGRLALPGVALGMRRLSIIDVAGGHQPMANEDGTVHVVFNGEIYNHHELHERLARRGHRFRTHSDTETLVHLYEDHGAGLAEHLRGMFGFAVYDATRRRLVLARDRLGQKPLYYWERDGGLAFASEVRSLRELPGFRADIDPAAVAEYLRLGYVPDPLCIYRGVRKLPPGHVLVWERGGGPARIERYWTPVRAEVAINEADAAAELRRLLSDAVRSHLESEVPLGAFLSGGVDSSAVVAEMARQLDRRVRTFSIGFDVDAFNEAPHAARVAAAIGTDHTELIVRPDADALVEQVVLGFDEPFADSSALPTYLVAELARRHVTVALSGDGGDELFGGYTRYAELLGRRELPAWARRVLAPAARALPHGAYGRNRLLDLSRALRQRYATTVASPLARAEGGVGRDGLPGVGAPIDAPIRDLFASAAGRDLLTQLTLVDLQSYLPGDILTKVDRMTMAVSLEARVPLLDHPLVEFAVALPSTLKLRDGTGKWIFREAIRDLVPPSVLEKPKQGFAVPLAQWFRGPLRYRLDSLTADDAPVLEFAEHGVVSRLRAEHLSGRRDQSSTLWRVLVLDLWLREHDGSRVPPLRGADDVVSVVGARSVP
jgi:asparagine synthase (glutamine-hydrolysing)